MADKTILLREDDIVKLSNISGNVDIDKLVPFIYMAQKTKILPMLGRSLYNKIVEDYENDELTGDYLIIYEEFVVEALVYFTAYFYWSIGLYQLDNNGAYKKTAENSEFLEDNELTRVAKFYDQQAQVVILAFKDFTKGTTIPELIEDKPKDNGNLGLYIYI